MGLPTDDGYPRAWVRCRPELCVSGNRNSRKLASGLAESLHQDEESWKETTQSSRRDSCGRERFTLCYLAAGENKREEESEQ
ncbi:hypothetical protein Tco_0485610 [Tanacetum coccineum]